MGFLNTNSTPRLVEKLADGDNIKITGNSKGSKVGTVIKRIVEKADEVTKAIEQEVVNNTHGFKVGTGNVDVSLDVEDGFGEVGIKGVTYHNIFNNFSTSGEASKYITANENTIKWTKSAATASNINIKYHNSLAQLSKTYTLVFYIYKNTLQREGAGDFYNVAKFNIVSYNDGCYSIPVNKTGLVKVKLIQPTTAPSDGKPYLEVYKDSVGELEVSYPILLEGDCTNDDKIPSQFEGIVGVGDKIEILSNGKNLFDGKWESGEYTTAGLKNPNSQKIRSVNSIKVTPNFQYTFSNNGVLRQTNVYVYDCNNVVIDYKNAVTQITPPSNASHITLDGASSDRDLFQIEKSLIPTSYEPYQEDKTQILLDEPLMRLPNGVCDEITRDGKLIRKVGKKFIDANISGLTHNGTSSNHNQFVIHKGVVTPNSINHANLLCDKKPCKVDNNGNNSVWVYNKTTLVFQMDATINSVEKMRQWLSRNPTTVYYELSTPVITELPAPYLRIFKDGHLMFNTLVAPESTHVVQLNKSSQIERSIREVQSLDNRVEKLESFYDDMMLETSHKLNLLTYDFEYTKESEDI